MTEATKPKGRTPENHGAEAIRRLFEPLGGVELEAYPDKPVGEPRVKFDP